MFEKLNRWVISGFLLSLLSANVYAEDEATPVANSAPPSVLAAFETAKPLSNAQLTDQRAKAKIEIERVTINDTDQDGAVTDNAAINNTTGHNSIAGDAFARADGFISTIQNTGNNVLIQNSTTINVSVEQ